MWFTSINLSLKISQKKRVVRTRESLSEIGAQSTEDKPYIALPGVLRRLRRRLPRPPLDCAPRLHSTAALSARILVPLQSHAVPIILANESRTRTTHSFTNSIIPTRHPIPLTPPATLEADSRAMSSDVLRPSTANSEGRLHDFPAPRPCDVTLLLFARHIIFRDHRTKTHGNNKTHLRRYNVADGLATRSPMYVAHRKNERYCGASSFPSP